MLGLCGIWNRNTWLIFLILKPIVRINSLKFVWLPSWLYASSWLAVILFGLLAFSQSWWLVWSHPIQFNRLYLCVNQTWWTRNKQLGKRLIFLRFKLINYPFFQVLMAATLLIYLIMCNISDLLRLFYDLRISLAHLT